MIISDDRSNQSKMPYCVRILRRSLGKATLCQIGGAGYCPVIGMANHVELALSRVVQKILLRPLLIFPRACARTGELVRLTNYLTRESVGTGGGVMRGRARTRHVRTRARSKEFCQRVLSNRYYTNPVDHASDLRKSRVHDFRAWVGMAGPWALNDRVREPYNKITTYCEVTPPVTSTESDKSGS